MRVPGGENPLRPLGVLRVPHERAPIGVHDEGAAAGPQYAMEFRQGGFHVGDVFIHLGDDGRVETAILEGQA